MMAALHQHHEFFGGCVLSRNSPYEADLVDQLFTSSKKRLARILLLLSLSGDFCHTPECLVLDLSA
jgi:hypothetical protein